jgi:DNA-directed RNA polymerase subunit beta
MVCSLMTERYDLAKVGRYKFNKKLSLATRIVQAKLHMSDIVDSETGEVLVEKDSSDF